MTETSEYAKLSCEAALPEIDDEAERTLLWKRRDHSHHNGCHSILDLVRRLLAGLTAIIVFTAVFYNAITVHDLSTRAATKYGDCGLSHTVEEARAKGCIFDPAGWVWTRPECYDADLVAGFMKRTELSYHTDPDLKRETEVPLEDVMRGDHTLLFTQNKYHYLHCTYMMKKMHKALLEHRPIDSYLRQNQHTDHCEMVLLNSILHEDEGLECKAGDICPTWLGKATWTSCERD